MVKLTRPGLATDAAGSLAALSFSHYKGRSYLKKKSAPKQPRTEKQMSMRAMMTFLSSEWEALPDWTKNSWYEIAQKSGMSVPNIYRKINLERWRSQQTPATIYPAWPFGAEPTTSGHTAIGGVKRITGEFKIDTPQVTWGTMIHRVNANLDPPRWQNLSTIVPAEWWNPATYAYEIIDLSPKLHWLAFVPFNILGLTHTNIVWKSATVSDI